MLAQLEAHRAPLKTRPRSAKKPKALPSSSKPAAPASVAGAADASDLRVNRPDTMSDEILGSWSVTSRSKKKRKSKTYVRCDCRTEGIISIKHLGQEAEAEVNFCLCDVRNRERTCSCLQQKKQCHVACHRSADTDVKRRIARKETFCHNTDEGKALLVGVLKELQRSCELKNAGFTQCLECESQTPIFQCLECQAVLCKRHASLHSAHVVHDSDDEPQEKNDGGNADDAQHHTDQPPNDEHEQQQPPADKENESPPQAKSGPQEREPQDEESEPLQSESAAPTTSDPTSSASIARIKAERAANRSRSLAAASPTSPRASLAGKKRQHDHSDQGREAANKKQNIATAVDVGRDDPLDQVQEMDED